MILMIIHLVPNGQPVYFDVCVWNTMQTTYILKSSTIVGAAAYAWEEEKDIRHEAEVSATGAEFYPLVAGSLVSGLPAAYQY